MTTQEAIAIHKLECDEARKKLKPGEWMFEVDRMNWKHAGLDCMIVRSLSSFGLCGYVGVPPSHPFFGKGYSEIEVDIDVHGGLTYAKGCNNYICHIPAYGELDHVHWFGFDCAHSGDLSPALKDFVFRNEKYRTIDYVIAEVNSLAEQLAEAKS